MVKSAAAFLMLALCWQPVRAQEKPALQTGPGRYQGAVHTLRIEKTQFRNPNGERRKNLVIEATYDTHGHVTASTSYKDDGTVHQKLAWESTYDAQGRVTKRLYINAAGELTNTGVYSYPKEHTVELVQINPDGSVNHNAIQLYDEAGNLVAVSRHYPRLGKTFYETMAYDERGNEIEHRSYNEKSVLTSRTVGKYDAYGNVMQWTVYRSDETPLQIKNRTLECDAKGNIVRAVNLGRDGSVQSKETMTYVFDDHGNWTRKATISELPRGASGTEIVDRTITYY
jgi:hypothetical protein